MTFSGMASSGTRSSWAADVDLGRVHLALG